LCRPYWDAGPWGYFQVARETCEQPLFNLAVLLKVDAEEETVARAYSDWVRTMGGTDDEADLAAAHAGCQAGLQEG
jgi:hypothetical protein